MPRHPGCQSSPVATPDSGSIRTRPAWPPLICDTPQLSPRPFQARFRRTLDRTTKHNSMHHSPALCAATALLRHSPASESGLPPARVPARSILLLPPGRGERACRATSCWKRFRTDLAAELRTSPASKEPAKESWMAQSALPLTHRPARGPEPHPYERPLERELPFPFRTFPLRTCARYFPV